MISIRDFHVTAMRHASASRTELMWKVLAKVRFGSDDPRDWGEFRAYGGAWHRTLTRRTKTMPGSIPQRVVTQSRPQGQFAGVDEVQSPKGLNEIRTVRVTRTEDTTQLLEPLTADDVDIEDADLQVNARSLPPWGHVQRPSTFPRNAAISLANDQHVEIFYAQVVPGVRRSDPGAQIHTRYGGSPQGLRLVQYDPLVDQQEADNAGPASDPADLDLNTWDIIARDEPVWAQGFKDGDDVEYWHQAEFQIREPGTLRVVARKRLFLRVRGRCPDYEYIKLPE